MLDWLKTAGVWVWDFVVGAVTALAVAAWDGFLETIPGVSGTSLEPFAVWLSIGNQYLPLDYAAALLVSYWAFVGAFVVGKMVLKFIPTIG